MMIFKIIIIIIIILFYFVVKICKKNCCLRNTWEKKTCFFHCHFCKIEKEKHIGLAMVVEEFLFIYLFF
jgi:hypothetical protein